MRTVPGPLRWVSAHRRASYAIAILVLAELWNASDVFAEDAGRTPWLNWAVIAFSAYAFFSVLVLLPLVLIPRARRPVLPAVWLAQGVAMSAAPVLVAFACYGGGAASWVMPVGFATSAVLLGVTFLRTPRDSAI